MLVLVQIDLSQAELALFDAYEAEVLPLLGKYGARLEERLRAEDGNSEVHLLYFPDDQALDALLLGRSQDPSIAPIPAAQGGANGRPATRLKEVDGAAHGGIAQPRHRHDLHHLDALWLQPHDLISPPVQLLQALSSRVFFFHDRHIGSCLDSSVFIGLNQYSSK